MIKEPRILIYDLETLPNKGYFFGLFDQRINPNFIIEEKSIVTIAYKWMHEKTAKVLSIADFGKLKNPYDDKKLLKAFLEVYDTADYTVAHYGDAFDTKFLHARAFLTGLPAPAPVAQIDTYKLAKRHFNLNSNRLDFLGKKLGFGGKMPMDWSYWVKCAEGHLPSIKKMAAYNKQDVVLLEKVFKKLLKSTSTKLNYEIFNPSEEHLCKHCGSKSLHNRGFVHTKTRSLQRVVCKDCGAWGQHKVD